MYVNCDDSSLEEEDFKLLTFKQTSIEGVYRIHAADGIATLCYLIVIIGDNSPKAIVSKLWLNTMTGELNPYKEVKEDKFRYLEDVTMDINLIKD